jgi:hypothetical protein
MVSEWRIKSDMTKRLYGQTLSHTVLSFVLCLPAGRQGHLTLELHSGHEPVEWACFELRI